MSCCGCSSCPGTCCYTLVNCVSGQGYLVKTQLTTQTACLNNALNTTIRITGSVIPDGCYSIDGCEAWDPNGGLPDPCLSAIWLPVTCIFTSTTYPICNDCVILQAVDCNDLGTIIYFHAAPSIIISLIINKVIFTSFPGYTERCWSITVVQSGSPITTLTTFNGPYVDCTTCQSSGGGCIDLLSTISGVNDKCSQKIGSATVTPTTGIAPFTYLWSNGQITPTISNLGSGVYSVTFTDSLGCVGVNTITLNNLPCDKNYLITFCDTSITPFTVTNPITTPNANPDTYLGPNIYNGVVTTSKNPPIVINGCFTLSPSANQGLPGVKIQVTSNSYNTCVECNPLAWKISRCDDPNLFYYTNDNLSFLEGKVIKNVILTGCDNTTYPCGTLPIQCWEVVAAPPGLFPVHITSYDPIAYPDCSCCKPC